MKVFENLKYSQLKVLLDVVNRSKEKHIDVVKRWHENAADNYQGASAFLKELKIIREIKNKIVVKKEFQLSTNSSEHDEILKGLILKELFTASGEMSKSVSDYLEKYKPARSSFEYRPTNAARVKDSPVRNFLIDLEFIQYNKATGVYRVKKECFNEFEIYLNQKKLTPQELAVILKRKEELGKAAELEILEYEKKRLVEYPQLIENIVHVAKKDVAAGYDILSWEKESSNGKRVERFVEVKVVSPENRKFYWSRNEIEKAKEFADQYHLYLLPVMGKEKFDVENLEVILNPISNVFNNSSVWSRRVETYMFSKAPNFQ